VSFSWTNDQCFSCRKRDPACIDMPQHEGYSTRTSVGFFTSQLINGWGSLTVKTWSVTPVGIISNTGCDPYSYLSIVVRFQHKHYGWLFLGANSNISHSRRTVPLALFFGFVIPIAIAHFWNDALGGFIWGGLITKLASQFLMLSPSYL